MLALKTSQEFKVKAVALVLLLASICFWQEGASYAKPRRVQKGVWGGEHIGLRVDSKGARLEYDCARGTIDQPIKVDSKGRFSVTGTHTRERGGPVMEGEPQDIHPALYTGQVIGRRMVISITLTDTRQTLGPFTLTFGNNPILTKCL